MSPSKVYESRRKRKVRTSGHLDSGEDHKLIVKDEVEDQKPIKVEEKPVVLTADSVTRRLAPYFKVEMEADLDQPELLVPVSRLFLSKRYGGSGNNTFADPREELVKLHGMDRFAFLMPKWNPNMPTKPAESGLAFTGVPCAEPIPLFAFKKTKEGNRWLYCCHYRFHASEPLTVQEWLDQDETVRNTWVNNYFRKNWAKDGAVHESQAVGEACARYRLRKQFRQAGEERRKPTNDEVEDCMARGEHLTVTPEEIREDYDSGFLSVLVDAVICVEYKKDFQLEILKGYRAPQETWPVFPPALKKKYARALNIKHEQPSLKDEEPADEDDKKPLGLKRELKEEEEEKEERPPKRPRIPKSTQAQKTTKSLRWFVDYVHREVRRKKLAHVR